MKNEVNSKARQTVTSIGTRKESSLHRSLKFSYSGSGGSVETAAGAYICDACTGDGELIEIQTGSFGPLKEKVKSLCKENKVRIIHPIIIQKTIELYDTQGHLLRKRKSPRKGSLWDIFNALVYASELITQKNLIIELAVIDAVEKRVDDGAGSYRRKGISITDRFLDTWHHSVILKNLKDYHQFTPYKKSEFFTAQELAKKAGVKAELTRKTLYVLTKAGLVEQTGKQGRAYLYRRKNS